MWEHFRGEKDSLPVGVQFNRFGRIFSFEVSTLDPRSDPLNPVVATLIAPYNNLTLPEEGLFENSALEYRVIAGRIPPTTWLPQTVMPRGTIVDLAFSGGETRNFAGGEKTEEDIPFSFSAGDDVVVMFSPAGHVDALYINGEPKKVNEMLYFCVGEWDRQIDANTGSTFAEDGKSNLNMSATFWVTLHPKTGGVRIAENAPIRTGSTDIVEWLRDARKFAREHFFNVGGR
jgi:hypothetical protein